MARSFQTFTKMAKGNQKIPLKRLLNRTFERVLNIMSLMADESHRIDRELEEKWRVRR